MLLGRLAQTVDDVDPRILESHAELFEDAPDGWTYQELLKEVGFHSEPATADEFLKEFISWRTSGHSPFKHGVDKPRIP